MLVATALSGAAMAKEPRLPLSLDTDARKAAYIAGFRLGSTLRADGPELDVNIVIQGLKDAAAGRAAVLPEDEHTAALQAWRQGREQAAAGANAEAGQRFLAANGRKPGVITLPSGLQYQVLRAGEGSSPKLNDMVKVHYRGTLIDGTEFDSSIKRGKPASFAVDQVIPGWTDALQRMRPGDKWQLFIPADLAYGPRRMGKIEPGSALVFEVELLDVVPGAER